MARNGPIDVYFGLRAAHNLYEHWDIIKDIRKHGAVYADGEPVLQNGVFLM
jgi:hypothetical protein